MAEVSKAVGYAILNYPPAVGLSKIVGYAVLDEAFAPSVGNTIGYRDDTWTGEPSSFTVQWNRHDTVDGAATAISGATSATYTTVVADEGKFISVDVVAINAGGSSAAKRSRVIGPVTA